MSSDTPSFVGEFQDFLNSKLDKKSDENKLSGLLPIKDWCSHVAVFFTDDGSFLGSKKVKYRERTFSWRGRTYNFLPDKSSFFKVPRIIFSTKYYFYNFNNAMPLVLDKKLEPVIDNGAYKSVLDSDLVKKLNPSKNPLLDLLFSWKGLVVLCVVIFLIYYFSTGGTIST